MSPENTIPDPIDALLSDETQAIETDLKETPGLSGEPPVEPPVEKAAQPEKPKPDEADEHGRVPVQALREERQRRQEEQRERANLQAQLNVWNRRWEAIQAAAQQQEQPKTPTLTEDPVQNLHQRQETTEQRLARIEAENQALRQGFQRQAGETNLQMAYQAAATAFRATTPDFPDAYQHLLASRTEELSEAFPHYPPEHIQRIVQTEGQAIVQGALQSGRNPAEALYKVALRRGFKSGAGDAPQAKIVQLKNGTQHARSLSAVGGSSGGLPSAEELANMSEVEFSKWAPKFAQIMRQSAVRH